MRQHPFQGKDPTGWLANAKIAKKAILDTLESMSPPEKEPEGGYAAGPPEPDTVDAPKPDTFRPTSES